MTNKYHLSIILTLVSSFCFSNSFAQADEQKIKSTIFQKDSLFWTAYNNCDTAKFRQFFTDDIEFYHDKGGITEGLDSLLGTLKKNLCGNYPSYQLRREAVKGTVDVYPMYKSGVVYGAIIAGEHFFYIGGTGKKENKDGHARFSDLWILKNGEWKMSRILSYDHKPVK